MDRMARHHPLLVLLHWLLALLIAAMLGLGFFVLTATPNADAHKLVLLRWHMATGMGIAALMLLRLAVRLFTVPPPPAGDGRHLLDRLAAIGHVAAYLLVFALVATGFATGLLAGLPAIVFGASGDPLPPTFAAYPTWMAHVVLAVLLLIFIAVHVAHALARRRLVRRMAFGRRESAPR
jgi:cytochrome b561